jgi:hypothetical protein
MVVDDWGKIIPRSGPDECSANREPQLFHLVHDVVAVPRRKIGADWGAYSYLAASTRVCQEFPRNSRLFAYNRRLAHRVAGGVVRIGYCFSRPLMNDVSYYVDPRLQSNLCDGSCERAPLVDQPSKH